MKVHNSQINDFINKVNSNYGAILVYGTDYGLICEKVNDLVKSYFKNINSNDVSHNVVEINSQELIKEPRLLVEESQSISLLSSKKIIKINNVTDSIKKVISSYLEKPGEDCLVLLQGNSFSPSSAIRKFFEDHDTAKIIACYSDDSQNIEIMITNMLKKENISIDIDAKKALIERLGLDRLVTKTEIEKAILFAGEGGNLNYKDTISFVGDQTLINLEKLSDTTFLGDLKSTFSILLRLEKDNTSSVEIIRVLLRQLHNLLRIKISTMSGLNLETVINSFRPPIYFKRKPNIYKQNKSWSSKKINRALSMLYKTEIECKKSGAIQKTLVRQVILGLCLLASKNIN